MNEQLGKAKEEAGQSVEALADAARHMAAAAHCAGETLRDAAHDAAHKVHATAGRVVDAAHSAGETLRDAAQDAAHKVHATAGRVVDAAHKVQQTASRVAGAVEAKVERAGQGARHAFDTGRKRATAFEHELESRIRAKPLKALLIAGSIGVFIGKVLRDR